MDDNLDPFSIFVRRRPLKVLYLLNEKISKKDLIKLIKSNLTKWGGRNNPMLLIKGQTLDDAQIQFIKTYDPDAIVCKFKPTKTVIKILDRISSPIFFELLKRDRLGFGFDWKGIEPIPIYPTQKIIDDLSHHLFRTSELILFDTSECRGSALEEFISVNFGIYEPITFIDSLLSSIKHRTFKIRSKQDFINAIGEISVFGRHPFFLNQISGYLKFTPNFEPVNRNNKFSVFVGSKAEDLVDYWLHTFSLSPYLRNCFSGFWIPKEYSKDTSFLTGLSSLLNRLHQISGTSQEDSIRVLSQSVAQTDLDNLTSNLTSGIPNRPWVENGPDGNSSIPLLRSSINYNLSTEVYKCYSPKESILLPETNFQMEFRPVGLWVVDLLIKRNNENSAISLPQRSPFFGQIFNDKPFRVNSEGSFSLVMDSNNFLSRSDNNLISFNFSSLSDALSRYLTPSFRYPENDLRFSLKKRSHFHFTEPSQEGILLQTIIELFGGLNEAGRYFTSKFWTNVFTVLSGKNKGDRSKQIRPLLDKTLTKKHLTDEESKEYFCNLLSRRLEGAVSTAHDIDWATLLKIGKKEMVEHNTTTKQNLNFNAEVKKELRSQIDDLLERRVLIMGVRLRCQSCNSVHWIPVNEVSLKKDCPACGKTVRINAEVGWHYRLNESIRQAIYNSGCIPTLLILHTLRMHFAGQYFGCIPSCELFTTKSKNPLAEVDFTGMGNGKFFIGEVKSSEKGYKDEVFEDIEKLALKIAPDIMFLGCTEEPTGKRLDKFTALKSNLSKQGIEVEWIVPRNFGVSSADPYSSFTRSI